MLAGMLLVGTLLAGTLLAGKLLAGMVLELGCKDPEPDSKEEVNFAQDED
jgi:hypothetical protein